MEKWLVPALDYIPRWLGHQMRLSEQPGCVLAVASKGELVFERAFGWADLLRRAPLTPRHRFRVASHSKTFTAAGVMKLRERGKLRLDDPLGRYVEGLNPAIAATTIAELLSHGAGIIRDGVDGGQWSDRRPFPSEAELREALKAKPVIEANSRFKYSNHGYGLAGLVIEAATGESYRGWIRREIIEAAGLHETDPDMPIPGRAPLAKGHGGKLPLGARFIVGGANATDALAAATGFVSTAADLVRFFSRLDPAAKRSVLSRASRLEMTRRHRRDPGPVESHYGLGVMSGKIGDWDWFGHTGGFQGFISRTVALPGRGLAVSVVTNSIDGPALPWIEGVVHILRAFAKHGAPGGAIRGWTGRWWSLWGPVDLVPMGGSVWTANPALVDPFLGASEISILGRDRARIRRAVGGASYGEHVRRERRKDGKIQELWLAGTKFLPEALLAAELRTRYRSG